MPIIDIIKISLLSDDQFRLLNRNRTPADLSLISNLINDPTFLRGLCQRTKARTAALPISSAKKFGRQPKGRGGCADCYQDDFANPHNTTTRTAA